MNRNLALAARRSAPWVLTVAATAGSAFALDGLVTAAGLALAASGLLSDLDGPLPLVFLVWHLPGLGRGAPSEPRRQLGAARPDRHQHQRPLEGRARPGVSAGDRVADRAAAQARIAP